MDCAERRGALKNGRMKCGGLLPAMGASFVRHRLSIAAGPPLATAGAVADWLANGGLTLAFWFVMVRTAWLGPSLRMRYVGGHQQAVQRSADQHRNATFEIVPSAAAAGRASPSALRAHA